jgi:hypothetical protein
LRYNRVKRKENFNLLINSVNSKSVKCGPILFYYKTILLATVYASATTNAIAYAANLARHVKAMIVPCYAYYRMVTHMEVQKIFLLKMN